MNDINIFTDGSCNPTYNNGGWAAIVLFEEQEITLQGIELNTTHNRMELFAVIKALEYINNQNLLYKKIQIYSDSQYLVNILTRMDKLKSNDFLTKKGSPIQNTDLVKEIINYIETWNLTFIKVKAHQKKSEKRNYNRDVDKISRKIVRDYVKNNYHN